MNDIKSIRFPPPVADEMVRAILEGRKTVTRRVVKPQPLSKIAYACMGYKHGTWGYPDKDAWKYWDDDSFRLPDNLPDGEKDKRWTPPCHTGDILYVRETWAPLYPNETSNEIVAYLYKADRDCFGEEYHKKYDSQYPNGKDYQWEVRWRPSANMPREAARLFLRVTDVRVERLHDMTMCDIQAEGVVPQAVTGGQWQQWARDYMRPLWDSTIKSADCALYGWAANPWVWVIEFERCEEPKEAKSE